MIVINHILFKIQALGTKWTVKNLFLFRRERRVEITHRRDKLSPKFLDILLHGLYESGSAIKNPVYKVKGVLFISV